MVLEPSITEINSLTTISMSNTTSANLPHPPTVILLAQPTFFFFLSLPQPFIVKLDENNFLIWKTQLLNIIKHAAWQ